MDAALATPGFEFMMGYGRPGIVGSSDGAGGMVYEYEVVPLVLKVHHHLFKTEAGGKIGPAGHFDTGDSFF